MINAKLSWKNHVDYIQNKQLYYPAIFYTPRETTSEALMRLLYYTLINFNIKNGIWICGET